MAIGLIIVPPKMLPKLYSRFKGIGSKIVSGFPGLRYDLKNAQVDMDADMYAVGAFFSSIFFGFFGGFFGLLIAIMPAISDKIPLPVKFILPLMGYSVVTFMFLILNIYYPRIMAKGVASNIDRQLIFATRDMLIQTSSGIPLYQVIANVAEGDYGEVSIEFKKVTDEVRSGSALSTSLENMAVRNQSIYLNKMSWQLITAMRSGSNLTTALKSIIRLLVDFQLRLIKSYNSSLNFIVLIYLMTAAVLPTIGSTMLVIFSLFGVLGISPPVYAGLVGFGFMCQTVIIFYIKSARPKIFD